MREKRGGRVQDEGKREEEGYRMREKRGGRIQDEGKEMKKDTG
jgi:hypothetical protein